MISRKRRGKTYRLYSVSYYVPGPFGLDTSDIIFLAIPALMKMLSVVEIENAISKAYRDEDVKVEVHSVSALGKFKRDKLPSQGCIIISRSGPVTEPLGESKDMVTTHDGQPVMVRMDWIV